MVILTAPVNGSAFSPPNLDRPDEFFEDRRRLLADQRLATVPGETPQRLLHLTVERIELADGRLKVRVRQRV
jgi:hypothetical protein